MSARSGYSTYYSVPRKYVAQQNQVFCSRELNGTVTSIVVFKCYTTVCCDEPLLHYALSFVSEFLGVRDGCGQSKRDQRRLDIDGQRASHPTRGDGERHLD